MITTFGACPVLCHIARTPVCLHTRPVWGQERLSQFLYTLEPINIWECKDRIKLTGRERFSQSLVLLDLSTIVIYVWISNDSFPNESQGDHLPYWPIGNNHFNIWRCSLLYNWKWPWTSEHHYKVVGMIRFVLAPASFSLYPFPVPDDVLLTSANSGSIPLCLPLRLCSSWVQRAAAGMSSVFRSHFVYLAAGRYLREEGISPTLDQLWQHFIFDTAEGFYHPS